MQFTFREKYKDNLILKETFEFALAIMKYAELLEEKRKYVLANQILKSGTSVGENAKEAQNAESPADFVHKMKVSAKEADEIEYGLFICQALENYPDCNHLLEKLDKIMRILNKIISSSKRKIN